MPLGEVLAQRGEQRDRSTATGLGVADLAQRDGAVDEQRVAADMAPGQRERFTGAKARVGENGHQRRVALTPALKQLRTQAFDNGGR